MLLLAGHGHAQVRVVPEQSQGGTPQGAPWEPVPEDFRRSLDAVLPPQWPLPTDLERWERTGRPQTRAILLELLGELPDRPPELSVEVLSREPRDGYVLERFRFHNGVDMVVPGILLIPQGATGPMPAVLTPHGHGRSKESVVENLGVRLVREGYVVAAIDAYYHGERRGLGPGGDNDLGHFTGEQESLVKLNLWLGRTLWGMMLRDQQILIDYLQTRTEVDPDRIGSVGISMGSTTSWWLAAIDERVKVMAGAVSFTRYTELIRHGELRAHGLYYFVPGVLRHFDTEAIYSLVAPRPMLHVSGDGDQGAPTAGVEVLEDLVARVYALYGVPDRFRSVVYEDTGHELLPEMAEEIVAWLARWLAGGPT